MGNDPATILFGTTPVRTITMNGVTKFVARDISSILGYSRSDKMLNAYVRTNPGG